MEALLHAEPPYSVHIKGTDRPPRQHDGIEIRCVDHVTPSEYEYIYQTYGFSYGIQRGQIDVAIAENRHHFIICNDMAVIRSLKRSYPKQVRVIFHYFDATRETLHAIQAARGIQDDEIELRLAKTKTLYKTFVQEQKLFDGVFYNHYGDSPEVSRHKMDLLLERLAAPVAAGSPDILAGLDQFLK